MRGLSRSARPVRCVPALALAARPLNPWRTLADAFTVAVVITVALAGRASTAGGLTPTPTATATPKVVEIHGRVFDAALGASAGIAGARVDFEQQGVRGSATTDAGGGFSFTLSIPDNSTLPVWATADGFVPRLQTFRAGDLRLAGSIDIALQPAPPRVEVSIYGSVYDASGGSEARIAGAAIHYQYYGSGVFPDAEGTLRTEGDGLYGLRLPLGGGDVVVFTIDAPGFATLRSTVGAFQLVTDEPLNFGIAPLGGVVQVEPATGEVNCIETFDVTISNTGPPGEMLVVLGIDLHHGYSQGDYGTGFSWDLSQIEFPVLLESGGQFSVPVSFSWLGQQYPSRLHMNVVSGAREGAGSAVFRSRMDNCPSTPTPPATATPTPTATATPQRTGDLGIKEVQGRVYDARVGMDAGIAGAVVTYGPRGAGTVQTDEQGDFAFSLFLHDTDLIIITAAAPAYRTVTLHRSGVELWFGTALDIGLEPNDGSGHRVWGIVHRDPYCGAEAQVRVVLEPLAGGAETPRSLVLPPSNEFAFGNVPDGDYVVRAESDCQPSYALPGTVYVRGADVYEELSFDTQCPPVVVIEPERGPPGTVAELNGRCYFIHSGGQGNIYLDGEPVTTVRAGTIGDYRLQIRIPATARPGLHYIHVNTIAGSPIGNGSFYVEPDVAAACAGDCNADGRVEIGELITGVGQALGVIRGSCSAYLTNDNGFVTITELVAAVGSALNGCT